MTDIELRVDTYTVVIDKVPSGEIQHDDSLGYIFLLPDAFSVTPMLAKDLRKIADLMDALPKSEAKFEKARE